jgi:hypothetical protein
MLFVAFNPDQGFFRSLFSPWGTGLEIYHRNLGAPSTPRSCFCGLGGIEPLIHSPLCGLSRHRSGGRRGFQPPHKANTINAGSAPEGLFTSAAIYAPALQRIIFHCRILLRDAGLSRFSLHVAQPVRQVAPLPGGISTALYFRTVKSGVFDSPALPKMYCCGTVDVTQLQAERSVFFTP